jgi:hypothetical protein
MMLSNPPEYQQVPLSASLPAVIRDHEGDGEGRATPPLVGNVSALKSRWEMEASRNWYTFNLFKSFSNVICNTADF